MANFQCECCNADIDSTEAEQPDGRYQCEDNIIRQFCCDDCFCESEENYRIGRIEAAEQFELYGADFDSWYR